MFKRQSSNTRIRRKSISGHGLIIEATKANGVVMVSQMKDMANVSWDLEESKIEVQLKLFNKQMDYQCQKDRIS